MVAERKLDNFGHELYIGNQRYYLSFLIVVVRIFFVKSETDNT
jgi:hypothetical protein